MRSWRRCLMTSSAAGVAAVGVVAGPAIAVAAVGVLAGPTTAAGGGASTVAARHGEASVRMGGRGSTGTTADLIQLGFQLVNLNSRKCLTVTAAGLDDNAIVIQKECTRE